MVAMTFRDLYYLHRLIGRSVMESARFAWRYSRLPARIAALGDEGERLWRQLPKTTD